ncbi:thioredoxin-like protein [Thozetella sp. PMI_491]|nr:thioredoxin-like protein [Thozetella sp. PMI_491]
METLYYIILAILALYFIAPENRAKALFGKSEPIPETSGNVYKITNADEFDALLSSTTNVVVDFYADWCPPCRAIAPVFSKLADAHAVKGGLAFAKVNVDHVNGVAGRYGVSAMPTFLFFEGGKPTPVAASSLKGRPAASLKADGLVDRIRGADPTALTAVVSVLAQKAGPPTGVATGADAGKAADLKERS